MKTRRLGIVSLAFALLATLPSLAWAQSASAIVGVVRDSTGAVIPGATIEAASPELIEKVKTAVSDDRGLYQIVDLRPGVYTVTFTLPGFSTVKREALELPANFTATINAEMKVGALEMVFLTSGAGAEVASPGVLQNMVPKQGGNEMHGSLNWVYSHRDWQAADLTPELIAKGLRQGNSLYALGNLEGGVGGKFIRDKFWWYSAARRQYAYNQVPDTQYPDGSPGVSEDTVKNLSLRLTGQLTRRNKLTGYLDRVSKEIGHDMNAGYDPVTASRVWEPSKLYQQAQGKWTSTLTNAALLEVGYAQYQAYRHTTYQPGIEPPYGTPEWYARAVKVDSSTGRTWNAAPGGNFYLMPARRFFSAIGSYVTAGSDTGR